MDIIESITAVFRTDDWRNVQLALGGTKDLSAYTRFGRRPPIPLDVLEALHIEDHFAARIVEAKPREAMRPGWDLVIAGEDPEKSAKVRDAYAVAEQLLGVAEELSQGAVWGRLFGGALTWVGAVDGRSPEAQLDENAITSVLFAHTYDRRDVQIESYYSDPQHPLFATPELYRVNTRTPMGGASITIVHESRCVAWGGQATTDTRRIELRGWDDSVLERCWDALRSVGEAYGAIGALLHRVSQAVYKFKGLWGMLSGKDHEMLRRRVTMLDASRSRARALVLDAEEDFVNVSTPTSGVELLLDRGVLRLASAAEMPVSVLMGQAPTGFNATGESDLTLWYASVETWRTLELLRRHERIARLILLSKNGPTSGVEPEAWYIAYRPLRMPTAREVAELDEMRARTDSIEIDKGIIPPEAVALARHTGTGTRRVELDAAEVSAALQRRRDLANAPPKDNAELGTVGARAGGGQLNIVEWVGQGRVSRESGKQILMQTFRLTPEDAELMLGPVNFVPASIGPESANTPAAAQGFGAGAPPTIPGLNQGGRPKAGE